MGQKVLSRAKRCWKKWSMEGKGKGNGREGERPDLAIEKQIVDG